MKEKLVSIAVPVYNVEKYLEECLNSIINQTYKRLEIILVNDGSTDSSLEICKKFLYDPRIILIDKKNEGLSIARQIAINRAKGEYLSIIDSDDFVENDFVEKLYTNISKQGSDIALCASRFFTESNNKVYGFSKSVSSNIQISKNDIENNYSNLLGQYYMSDSWAKMYKLSFIHQTNIKFTLNKTYNGTDALFNHLLMLYRPKISIVNIPLYNHRIHAESRVHRKDKKMQEGFELIMDSIISESQKLDYSRSFYNQLSTIFINFCIIAAQDIVTSNTRYNSIQKKLKKIRISYITYIEKQKKLTSNYKVHIRITSKFFSLLLKYNLTFLEFLYLKLRQFRTYLSK